MLSTLLARTLVVSTSSWRKTFSSSSTLEVEYAKVDALILPTKVISLGVSYRATCILRIFVTLDRASCRIRVPSLLDLAPPVPNLPLLPSPDSLARERVTTPFGQSV
jgi:hypothetical protein